MDVEDRLQQLFRLQPLQDKVLALRSEIPTTYKNDLKLSCEQEMQNLVNVEISLIQTKIKLPDPVKVPPIYELPWKQGNLNDLAQDQESTIEALRNMDLL